MLKSILSLVFLSIVAPAGATEAGWALLRDGGQVVLMRHAYAPGATASRDLPDSGTADCIGEGSLSERGRQQARRIGALFAARAAPIDEVLTSRYCRCVETARIAFGSGLVHEFPALNAFGSAEGEKERQTAEALERIRAHHGYGNLVLITDIDNIAALTGSSAREGEALIVRPEGDTLHVSAHVVFN